MLSIFSRLRLRKGFLESFLGLSKRFKIMIFAETFQMATIPDRWFSLYLNELGAKAENIGLINAVGSGIRFLLQLPGGIIGQKFDKKKLYLLGLALSIAAFFIAFLAIDWTWALLMTVVLSFSSLVDPGVSALVGEITSQSTRATALAVHGTVNSIIEMAIQPLQGFIAESMSLRSLYLFAILGFIISFLMFLRFFPSIKAPPKTMDQGVEEKAERKAWRQQLELVFARPEYRRNLIGLLQAGVAQRLFYAGFTSFISIYLYETIGWSYLFFGFFGLFTNLLGVTVKIPFGKIMDKYRLRRFFFFAGPVEYGIRILLMAFIKDPYLLATFFLALTTIDIAHVLSVGALWYDAIPQEVYSLGMSFVGIIYGVSNVAGALLGAYLWVALGPISSFYLMATAQFIRGFIALHLIRDLKKE